MATITQKIRHEKSTAWGTGYQWHVLTFVDGQLRQESFTGAQRRAAQREGAKIARDMLEQLPEIKEERTRMTAGGQR